LSKYTHTANLLLRSEDLFNDVNDAYQLWRRASSPGSLFIWASWFAAPLEAAAALHKTR